MTFSQPGPWDAQHARDQAQQQPVGDPVYVAEPYPYAYPAAYSSQYGAPPPGHPYGGPYPQPYPYPYAPAPRPVRIVAPSVGFGLVGSAVFVIASAFMPWAQVFGVSVNGTDGTGDGNLTLFLGVLIAAMGVVIACAQGRLWSAVVACVCASFVVITSFKDIADVNGFANDNGLDPSAVSIGAGLWFTLLAGLVSLAFSIVGLVRRTTRTA